MTLAYSVYKNGDHEIGTCDICGLGGCGDNDIIIPSVIDGLKVVSITDLSFSSITSVKIPEGITSIGDGAFEQCGELVSVTLPNSLETIGNSAFNRCARLKDIEFQGTKKEFVRVRKGGYWYDNTQVYEVVCSDGPMVFRSR